MRVSIIFDNFGPYHVTRVEQAAKHTEITGIEIREKSRTYGWSPCESTGFRKITLLDRQNAGNTDRNTLTRRLEAVLDSTRPEVVAINGWGDFLAPQTIRWCVMQRIPFIIMSESSAMDRRSSQVSLAIKRRIVRLASASLVGGTPHRDFMIQLGQQKTRIFLGYNVVDNAFFERHTNECRLKDNPCKPYFLASNRFIDRKNVAMLIEAFSQSIPLPFTDRNGTTTQGDDQKEAWNLCLLGGGEKMQELISHCKKLGLNVVQCAPWEAGELYGRNPDLNAGRNDRRIVFFPGFREYRELPRFYAHAGCFIHPALVEPWGLVVNEAMASGLPVIVSNQAGCSVDLVIEGANGFKFDPRNLHQLVSLMAAIQFDKKARLRMGHASKDTIARFSPEHFAIGLRSACECALGVGPPLSNALDRLLLSSLCYFR